MIKWLRNALARFIKSHGANYLLGISVSPVVFVLFSLFSGVFFLLIALFLFQVNLLKGFFFGAFGILVPALILVISNEADNDAMLVDIKNIFEFLKIQLHAGVYVVDALENCMDHVKNKRLHGAMKNLLNDIFLSKNLNSALDEFGAQFSNHHMDILVIILKQSMESGYSVNNLDNAFEEVLDVERAINIRMENSVERNVQILQVLFMAAMIAISIYCSVVELKGLFQIG